jgi:hypothetical protein
MTREFAARIDAADEIPSHGEPSTSERDST